jgi:hypothetical protein
VPISTRPLLNNFLKAGCYLYDMKKIISFCFAGLLVVVLASWGFVGHRTIATIAENHLTPKAKAGIKGFWLIRPLRTLLPGRMRCDLKTRILNTHRPGII